MEANNMLQNYTADELFSKFMDPDNLTEKWILTSTPVPVVTLLAIYLLVVLKIGPEYMKGRDSCNLEFAMRLYNVVQVLYNGFLIMLYFKTTSERNPLYFLTTISCRLCEDFDGITDLKNHLLFAGWNFIMIKLIDLLDTVFMVLRKKSSQVTFLHVYHHAATVFFTWYSFRYIKAPQGALLLLLNSFVHVVMYIYYFLATFDSLKKYLWWKQALTKLQLTQFVLILSYFFYLYYEGCLISRAFTMIWIFNVVVVMSLFVDFYVKAYVTQSSANQNDPRKVKNS